MNIQTYSLTFITPCFCAGADQATAELRASAIRGQLRWWFRALGGTARMEGRLFGSVAENETGASMVMLRTRLIQRGSPWQPFPMKMGTDGAYIWYFASVASDKKRWWKTPPGKGNQPPGSFNPAGHLPPGTRFELQVALRRQLPSTEQELWQDTLEATLRFGGMGMRLTRGMGAWDCGGYSRDLALTKAAANRLLEKHGFTVRFREAAFTRWQDVVFDAEKWLRDDLRKEFNANRRPESPLGGIRDNPKFRQTSAVYLRPIVVEGGYGLLLFEAPHERILTREARTSRPILSTRTFAGAPPASPPRRGRRW